jgi:dolichyl-phosphate-mannose--protein O-mannosyl transferase
MSRALLDSIGLFLIPFALYAAFLVFRARHPLLAESWSRGTLSWLSLAGLALAIAGVIYMGFFGAEQGAYVPARVENGRLLPGHFQ